MSRKQNPAVSLSDLLASLGTDFIAVEPAKTRESGRFSGLEDAFLDLWNGVSEGQQMTVPLGTLQEWQSVVPLKDGESHEDWVKALSGSLNAAFKDDPTVKCGIQSTFMINGKKVRCAIPVVKHVAV